MTAADEHRINAMATARAIKAVRLFAGLTRTQGGPPTAEQIVGLDHAARDLAVRVAGVKVASEGTWKVTEALAAAFEGVDTRKAAKALGVAVRDHDEGGYS